jgi:DNA-binding NtrC family response regulator
MINNSEENKYKVLIVDDEEQICEMFDLFFSDKGHSVLTANNGLEATKLCKEHSDISVIITDFHMPICNGYKFLEQIQTYDALKISMSGNSSEVPDKFKKFPNELYDVFLDKPVKFKELKKIIDNYAPSQHEQKTADNYS